MDEINLPLPRQKVVILRRGRTFSRRTSSPLDRAHVTDEHRRLIVEALEGCAESNTARPVLIQLARILVGDETLRRAGLL